MENVLIVLPAYNAADTLEKTVHAIPLKYRKNILLVDDHSQDKTVKKATSLGLSTIVHDKNLGYGGNQKTCFTHALKTNADIIVMIHPDYQYPPQLTESLVAMIQSGLYDCVFGSRILCGGALKGHMPIYKYIANRFLTAIENLCTGLKLSEYHTGLRAYKSSVLKALPFGNNSNDFIFDNQIILQIAARKFRIGEISSPCNYFPEASSINLKRSTVYGILCLYWGFIFWLGNMHIYKHKNIFPRTTV